MATVYLGPSLRDLAEGARNVEAYGTSVRELVADLERRFPGIRERLCDGDQFRPGTSVAIDDVVFGTRVAMFQVVRPDSEVHFIIAIAGG